MTNVILSIKMIVDRVPPSLKVAKNAVIKHRDSMWCI